MTGDRPITRFVILSSPRCGTHMLRSSFDRHPSVVAHTEIFNPDWNRNEPVDESMSAAQVLENYWQRGRYPAGIGAVGFALHRSGAGFGDWPDLWPLLEDDTGIRVLSLRRMDLLRRYLSFCVMRERARSGEGAAYAPAPRAIPAEELQAEFERAERELSAFDERFAAHPLLPLTYEQLCDDYETVMTRIHLFLGVRPVPVAPTLERNRGAAAEDLVTNFTELAAIFAPTRWGWFFRSRERVAMQASAAFTLSA